MFGNDPNYGILNIIHCGSGVATSGDRSAPRWTIETSDDRLRQADERDRRANSIGHRESRKEAFLENDRNVRHVPGEG